jgi:hypothetical protein
MEADLDQVDAVLAGELSVGVRVRCLVYGDWVPGTVVNTERTEMALVELDNPKLGHYGHGFANDTGASYNSGYWWVSSKLKPGEMGDPVDESWLLGDGL